MLIWADDDITYQANGRRTTARSWNLSDDLGQIEYVFSDKTGTLTQNSMVFHHATINGKVYLGDSKAPAETIVPSTSSEPGASDTASSGSSSDPDAKLKAAHGGGAERKKVKPAAELTTFHDDELDRDMEQPDSAQAQAIHAFCVNLALCHTVLAAEGADGLIQYKAQSPDEAALVQAAADMGFVFRGRDRNLLRLQTPTSSEPVEYELLQVLEFTSARKRMSVVVRKLDDPAKPLYLLMKGADNVIFDRLAPGQEALRKQTDKQLDTFANEGLRTLTLAYRGVDEDEYADFATRFHEAEVMIEGRDDAMAAIADKFERRVRLLGATAIEDRLQDGVPEAIAALKRAGIKVRDRFATAS